MNRTLPSLSVEGHIYPLGGKVTAFLHSCQKWGEEGSLANQPRFAKTISYELKNTATVGSSNPSPGYLLQRNENFFHTEE